MCSNLANKTNNIDKKEEPQNQQQFPNKYQILKVDGDRQNHPEKPPHPPKPDKSSLYHKH